MSTRLIAILPANDLDASTKFYARLGFAVLADHGDYRVLADDQGAELHLRRAEPGSVRPAENPFGLYLYADDVDALARSFAGEVIGQLEDKPWGM